MSETIFSRIIRKEIPADFLYEDEHCVAIRDINPQAPVHILVIPRKLIPQLSKQKVEDKEILGHILSVIPLVAEQEGIGGEYRLVMNDGVKAGQTVFHLHFHILGGRLLQWPPG